ncbi:MAG: shikimate dehydrogenase [Bacteroidia bacterium]|nr:shikimate dehydrogenase [Bacteroidia bacterium]
MHTPSPVRQYGLIGKKLGHSFSRRYFTEKFEREGIAAQYDLFELADIGDLPGLLVSRPQLAGLNVTIPYKTEIIPLLHALTPEAAAIGAVNTVHIHSGRLIGHNTDALGFHQSMLRFLGSERPAGALVLGTGGASKAVVYALENWMQLPVQRVSRRAQPGILAYEDLHADLLRQFPLIVNTTPLGMYPDIDSAPQLPYEVLGPAHWICDLVYNPARTLLMHRAAMQGARVCNGLDMLIFQAEAAWTLWSRPV